MANKLPKVKSVKRRRRRSRRFPKFVIGKNSLMSKIVGAVSLLVGGSLLLVAAINIIMSYYFLHEALVNEMSEVSLMASHSISQQLSYVVDGVEMLGMDTTFQSMQKNEIKIASRCAVLKSEYSQYVDVNVIDRHTVCVSDEVLDYTDGKKEDSDVHTAFMGSGSTGKALDYTGDENFATMLEDDVTVVTAPYYIEGQDVTVFDIYSPIHTTDISKTVLGGIHVKVNIDVLNTAISNMSIGRNGYAFVIDKNGLILSHPDETLADGRTNYIELAKTDSSYEAAGKLMSEAILGEAGYGEANIGGSNKLVYYTPISGTDGWSLILVAFPEEHTQNVSISIIITIVAAVLCFLASIALVATIIRNVIRPVTICTDQLEKLAAGDLNIPQLSFDDNITKEIKQLSESTNLITKNLKSVVADSSAMLEAFSTGNLTYEVSDVYVGDFEAMRRSFDHIKAYLNATIGEIRKAGGRVSKTSHQVSTAANNLSSGAATQATSVEALSNSIAAVTEKVDVNARHTEVVAQNTRASISLVQSGNEEVQKLLDAMTEISETSKKIEKIIKTIDDISFQTNILALNAAVEASRAGEAGKSFAVVADEVRNLANKVAEAAKTTTDMIQESLEAVDNGRSIANTTAETLSRIVESTEETARLVNDISVACIEQADTLKNITQGIDSITTVVQSNSVTSGHCAVSAEELSSQAEALNTLVSKFRIEKAVKAENPQDGQNVQPPQE